MVTPALDAEVTVPRLPDRKSTQKTLKIEYAMVHSFLMPFEDVDDRYNKKVCVIEGCDHRLGNCVAAGDRSGAYVGTAKIDDVYGVACGCCVDKIIQ